MTETEARNEMIGTLNIAIYSLDRITKVLSKMYSKSYPNFAKIYQDKIYDLEEYFKSKGLPFYDNNLVSSIILQHFNILYLRCTNLINTIAQNICDMPDNKLAYKAILFLNRKYVTEYEKLCSKMANFSLQNNLEELLIDTFRNLKYYDYKPNEITDKYIETKETLIQADLKIENLDDKIMPYIKKYEKEAITLYEIAKQEINSDDEEEIKNYINNIVSEVKQELNGKQKHM